MDPMLCVAFLALVALIVLVSRSDGDMVQQAILVQEQADLQLQKR
jgi:hypothetical protein